MSKNANKFVANATIEHLTIEEENISQRAQENRKQRIEIARRLNDIRNHNENRDLKRRELESEMKLIEKKQLIEELVNKRRALDEIKKKKGETVSIPISAHILTCLSI